MQSRFDIRRHRLRSVRGFPVQQQRHDSDRSRGLEIVEPIIYEDTVLGLDSESMRDLLPVPGLSFLRVLRMAREDPVDQVEQAGATQRCVVRLAAARGHVHPVSGQSESLDAVRASGYRALTRDI